MSSLLVTKAAPRRRVWPWALGGVAAVCLAALAFAFFAWPSGGLRVDANGLPQVQQPRLSGDLVALSLHDAAGRTIPVELRPDGTLRPGRPVPAGTRLEAEAVFRRPGWVGWIAGRTQRTRLELTAPTARLASRWLRVERGAPVRIGFDRPVREVRVTGVRPRKTIHLTRPARTVALGRFGDAGSVGVSAVALDWERLPPPTAVTWFPPGRTAMVLPSPDAGKALGANAPLRLRFSDPVAQVLGRSLPALEPATPGRWRRTDAHTLEFRPRGYGFGLDSHVKLKLPVAGRGGRRRPADTDDRLDDAAGLRAPPGGAARSPPLLAPPMAGGRGRRAADDGRPAGRRRRSARRARSPGAFRTSRPNSSASGSRARTT